MIGLAVQPADHDTAREFFELCKTPWEFFQPGRRYDVVLCSADCLPLPAARLVLVFSADHRADAEQASPVRARGEGLVVSYAGKRLPVYGSAITFPESPVGLARDELTHESIIHAHWQDGVVIGRIGYDLFHEIRHLLTAGQPARHAGSATLDLHIQLLRDLITRAGIPFVEIPPVPEGYKFAACLTHDVDHPVLRNHFCDHTMFGFLYRATLGSLKQVSLGRITLQRMWKNWFAALRLPLVYMGLVRDFWQDFDRYLDLEAGRPSTFFVIPERDNPGRQVNGSAPAKRACRYGLTELTPVLERIRSAGGEVGLHGIDAWLDAGAGRREREKIARTINTASPGVRMHWLYFDRNSPVTLDVADFSYDSTVGYNDTVGYRAGTTQVYRPPGTTNLLELPLHVMDTALFYPDYLDLAEQEARELVCRMADDTVGSGGVLTVNWHDRSIAPERQWGDFYVMLMGELQRRGAWFATASHAVAWFQLRRTAVLEAVSTGDGAVCVRMKVSSLDSTLPGLKIRLHKPHAPSPGELLSSGPDAGFVDLQPNPTKDLEIKL